MESLDLAKFQHLKSTGDLPSPKGPAMMIVRLAQQENTSLADLVRVAKADPALAGRLIKAANSAQLGAHRPVAALQDALTLLGIPAARSLALGFSLLSDYRQGKCSGFAYSAYWSHSLACGVALQSLAQHTHAAPPEDCFSVGLLARIGELALATLFPDEYTQVLSASRQGGELLDGERQSFAMTHGELSAAMLIDWGLPKLFAEAVRYHDCPDEAGFAAGSRSLSLLWSLVLAERIADICLAPQGDRRAMMPELFMLGGKLSIAGDALITLCNKVVREWQDWGAVLNVGVDAVPPFEELAVAAQPDAGEEGGEERRSVRVLLVSGEDETRASLGALLTEAGHEVAGVGDGQSGFEMAIQLQPQILIADRQLSALGVIQMTRALRQTKIGRGIYVLMLTTAADEDRLIEALDAGVDDFVTLPLRPRLFAARLRAGLRVIRLQEEVERDREDIRRFAAELAVTNRRLQEAALTDPLTGFPNRRYAMERLEQEWAASSRSKRSLVCMIVDVDRFKQINDSLGHDAGDAVLKQVANALKRGVRAQDVVARIGGDEFLVICPDTTLVAALACAERMRGGVEGSPAVGSVEVSVSIGVGVRGEGMRSMDDLIKRADESAYLAKQRGRNRVVAAQGVS